MGTLNGLKHRSDGILFVSEKKSLYCLVSGCRSTKLSRDGARLERVVDGEVVKHAEIREGHGGAGGRALGTLGTLCIRSSKGSLDTSTAIPP